MMWVAALVLVALDVMVWVGRAVGRGAAAVRVMVTSPGFGASLGARCFTPTKYLRAPRPRAFGQETSRHSPRRRKRSGDGPLIGPDPGPYAREFRRRRKKA